MRIVFGCVLAWVVLAASPVEARIRVDEAVIHRGTVVISGRARPHLLLRLNGRVAKRANRHGRFLFRIRHVPRHCTVWLVSGRYSRRVTLDNCRSEPALQPSRRWGRYLARSRRCALAFRPCTGCACCPSSASTTGTARRNRHHGTGRPCWTSRSIRTARPDWSAGSCRGTGAERGAWRSRPAGAARIAGVARRNRSGGPCGRAKCRADASAAGQPYLRRRSGMHGVL